jgi:acetyl esterase/lipase
MSGRTVTLRLRGRHGPLDARIHWPSPAGPARLLVTLGLDDRRARTLCDASGRIVLALGLSGPVAADDAWDAVRWLVAHATDLGTLRDGVRIAGIGTGTDTARRVAALADSDGWPPLTLTDVWDLDPAGTAADGPRTDRGDVSAHQARPHLVPDERF